MKDNIILIGMMGAGKSTIGVELHKALPNFKIVDIDEEIEKKENKKISDIFKDFGEHYFRELETKLIEDICKYDKQIIATGGGIFEKDLNQKILKDNGQVFYLKASPETLYARIKNQTHRPLLKQGFGIENIKTILEQREHNYAKAHTIIDTENKPIYNIVEEIRKKRICNE